MKVRTIYISLIFLLSSAGLVFGQQADSLLALKKSKAEDAVKTMVSDPTFAEAVVGICVTTGSGENLAEHNSRTMLVPASNMKLITTGAAIHTLGKDFRFETRLGYKGQIENGTLKGNLYILGGGDPTLGSKDTIATPLEQTFGQWKQLLEMSHRTWRYVYATHPVNIFFPLHHFDYVRIHRCKSRWQM